MFDLLNQPLPLNVGLFRTIGPLGVDSVLVAGVYLAGMTVFMLLPD